MLSRYIRYTTKTFKNTLKSLAFYLPFTKCILEKIIILIESIEYKLLFYNKTDFIYYLNKNTKISLNKNSIISKYILNDFEYDEVQLIHQVVKKNDIVLDIGAHIGFYTLQLANIVGNQGTVYAYEASPKNYSLLKKNIGLNNFNNIVTKNIAISNNYNNYLNIYENSLQFDAFNSINYAIEKNASMHTINSTTIDNEIAINNIDQNKISFIKIDVEGWEYFVLSGATNLIEAQLPILFMVEFSTINENSIDLNKKVYDFMTQFQYEWYDFKVANKALKKIAFIDIKENCNLFAIHASFFIKHPKMKR